MAESITALIARCDLPSETFAEIALPFLNRKARQICLAWNPRTLRLRSEAYNVAETFKQTLALKP